MRMCLFLFAKIFAMILPIWLSCEAASWLSERIVGDADPIMHPIIYLGPAAFLLGIVFGGVGVLFLSGTRERPPSPLFS